MNRVASLLLVTLAFFLPDITVFSETIPSWQEGYLDIHNIATGKGDASFIIMPDGTKMIIDAGDVTGGRFICPAYPSDSLSPAQWISRYVREMSRSVPGNVNEVDYFLLTHFHSDHMGSMTAMHPGKHYGICGIMELCEEIHFGKIVDRGYPHYCFPSKEHVETKTAKGVIPEYLKCISYQRDSCGTEVEGFDVGSRKQFRMKNKKSLYGKSFSIHNVAANGEISTGRGSGTRKMYSGDPSLLDENMFSTVLTISFGPFKYYNGGDIGGGVWRNYRENRDFESQVADVVGPVTVMKADHHAWKEVLNPYFLWKTRPQVVVVQCSHINHPWKDTVQRLLDPLLPVRPDIYVTTDSGRTQVGEDLFKHINPAGHTVIRVYDGGNSFQVFVLDAKSTDYKVIYQSDVICTSK